MSFEYIKDYYGKSFKKGQAVTALGKVGVITKATNYVFVKLNGDKTSQPYHPDDVT